MPMPVTASASARPFGSGCGWRVLSFGGPAGQIAVMHRILVEEKNWISESRFLHALNYCMLLPGPEAQQLATYIGWLLHRTAGGIMAGGLFILPGIIAIMGLSYIYAAYGNVGFVEALFFGLKAAVLAIVIQAVVRVGKRALRNRIMIALAAIAFVAIFFFNVPFPIIIIARRRDRIFRRQKRDGRNSPPSSTAAAKAAPRSTACSARNCPTMSGPSVPPRAESQRGLAAAVARAGRGAPDRVRPGQRVQPDRAVLQQDGDGDVRRRLCGAGLCRAAGGRALSLVGPREMLDGLGMAETTPGPLIMVLQFVGFMAAYRDPGALSPMLAGTLGGLLATWVTFTPCFLWIFLGAPFIEILRGNKGLAGALTAITAAVVGVILNLSIWFALHTVFRQTSPVRSFGLSFDMPVLVERRCSRTGSGGGGRDRDLPLQHRDARGAGRLCAAGILLRLAMLI